MRVGFSWRSFLYVGDSETEGAKQAVGRRYTQYYYYVFNPNLYVEF